jgi:HAD superfamily hydrolase (TIGR01509 family)
MVSAVIFDMDGLMLDTERISLDSWLTASRDHGALLSEEVCRGMIGLGQAEFRNYLRGHLGDDHQISQVAASAQAHYVAVLERDGVACKPGLFELLEFLEGRHIPRAVATSTVTSLATRKLKDVGALSFFEAVVGGDQVSKGKPAPDIFLRAAQFVGCEPQDCVVLEDSGHGIRAAAAAGMKVIWVPDICEVDRRTAALAFATAPSLAEVGALIEALCHR